MLFVVLGYCSSRAAVAKFRAEVVYVEFMKQWNTGVYFSLRYTSRYVSNHWKLRKFNLKNATLSQRELLIYIPQVSGNCWGFGFCPHEYYTCSGPKLSTPGSFWKFDIEAKYLSYGLPEIMLEG